MALNLVFFVVVNCVTCHRDERLAVQLCQVSPLHLATSRPKPTRPVYVIQSCMSRTSACPLLTGVLTRKNVNSTQTQCPCLDTNMFLHTFFQFITSCSCGLSKFRVKRECLDNDCGKSHTMAMVCDWATL